MWLATSDRRRRQLGCARHGERWRSDGCGWYQRVAEAIAHLLVYSQVVKVDGGGRRRAQGGGEDRVLSDEASGDAPAKWVVPGGRSGDGEPGGADQ